MMKENKSEEEQEYSCDIAGICSGPSCPNYFKCNK